MTVEQPLVAVTKGPRWTRKRLIDMLIDCYGPSPRGAVNVTAVADYLSVSTSTVRRWLTGANNRRPPMPRRRIEQLQLGSADAEIDNEQQYRYALNAIADIAAGRSTNPYWGKHGWLDPHTVAVIELRDRPWRQVAFTKGESPQELRKRGTIIDTIIVPTRLHARVLVHIVMLTMRAWRVHPAAHRLTSRGGSTRVWMSDAPTVDLEALSESVICSGRAG